MKIYRQGDVLITDAFIPTNAKQVEVKDRVILAEGEVTGHAHAIVADDCEMYEAGGSYYIHVNKDTQILHEEHAPINLPPGNYAVVRQREYRPEENIRVAD